MQQFKYDSLSHFHGNIFNIYIVINNV